MKIWFVLYLPDDTVSDDVVATVEGVYATHEAAMEAAYTSATNDLTEWPGFYVVQTADGFHFEHNNGTWGPSWDVEERDLQLPEDKTPKLAISKSDVNIITDSLYHGMATFAPERKIRAIMLLEQLIKTQG